ncbi:hypothetical protein A2U01_0081788, partial [Trifolium medium]|nr:hypothetical protein [Trifolium medium]
MDGNDSKGWETMVATMECHVVERAKCNGGLVYNTSCRNGELTRE